MQTPVRQHPNGAIAYPDAQGLAFVQSNIHAAWLIVARAIFGGFFLFSGLSHFLNVAFMTTAAAGKGVPSPQLAILASGAMIVAGGLSLILGAWPRIGASLIIVFLLVVTPVMHDFWNATDPQLRMNDFGHFLKNMGLLGGACFAMALPLPWPGSVHARDAARSAG